MKNERGYTLVIVLLIITLIFSFSLVLIGDSVNSAKQNNKTESNYRATHIAEMGITYVQEKLMLVPIDHLRSNDKLKDAINVDNKVVDPDNPLRQFNIDFIGIDGSDTEKTLKFKSIGSDDENKAELTASMIIKIPLVGDEDEAGTIDIGDIEIDIAEIIREEPIYSLSEVPQNWFDILPRETYIFQGDSVFPQFGIGNDSAVIVKGGAEFNGSLDTKKNFILGVNGDTKFNNSLNPSDGTKFLINGSVDASNIGLGKNSLFKALSLKTNSNLKIGEGSQFLISGAINATSVDLGKKSVLKASSFDTTSNINIGEESQFLISGLVDATTVNLGKHSVFNATGFKTKTNINLEENSFFSVCNNSEFGTATLKRNTTNICNDAQFNGNINFTNSTIANIKNNANFDGTFKIDTGSELNIGNDLTVGSQATVGSSTMRVFGGARFNTQATITGSQLMFYNDFAIQRANISNSTVQVLKDATFHNGISMDNNSKLFVYGKLTLGSNSSQKWQFIDKMNNVCARQIETPGWSQEDRERLGIITVKDKKKCEGLGSGIYELEDLEETSVPNKNDYFTECTNSCRINNPSEGEDPTIELFNVTY